MLRNKKWSETIRKKTNRLKLENKNTKAITDFHKASYNAVTKTSLK